MRENLRAALDEWKATSQKLLHAQEEAYFALVELLDVIIREETERNE